VNRLVLDVVDDGPPPSVLGLSTSLSDISLVFALNAGLSWQLVRHEDWRCVQKPLYSTHALYRGVCAGQDVSLLWNLPESTDWIQAPAATSADLFSEEVAAAPKRVLVQKPKNLHALLIVEPELSPQEMVILQRRIASIPGVVGQNILPWSTLRERENFLFEPLNTEV